MTLTVFRCGHEPENLNDRFERLFSLSEIVVIEQASLPCKYEIVKEYYNQLSSLGYSRHQPVYGRFKEFTEKLDSFIKNSKKQIEIERSPISRKESNIFVKKLEDIQTELWYLFARGKLEKACEKRVEAASLLVKETKERDNSLTPQLIELQMGLWE